jgi:hypothetical protein
MKAARFTQFGGPEVLEIVDLPNPHAGRGKLVLLVDWRWVRWRCDNARRSRMSAVGVEAEVDRQPDARERNQHPKGACRRMPDDDWSDARADQ